MNSNETDVLIQILQTRFRKNPRRHEGMEWLMVEARIRENPDALESLARMEATGGEPDVTGPGAQGQVIFCDCSPESPSGRRSLCYDEEARLSRKANPPAASALGMAQSMGIQLLDEEAWGHLQSLGEFDCKTSSWLLTPGDVRSRGGALFGDRRYGRIFTCHNGADSYYAARGFRGMLRV